VVVTHVLKAQALLLVVEPGEEVVKLARLIASEPGLRPDKHCAAFVDSGSPAFYTHHFPPSPARIFDG